MSSINKNFFFPKPPSGFWEKDCPKNELENFSSRILNWQKYIKENLHHATQTGLSDKMKNYLLKSINSQKESFFKKPIDVMIWRADMIYYLSDVSDVIGEPEFEQKDCDLAINILTPCLMQTMNEDFCYYCLKKISKDPTLQKTHNQNCPIVNKFFQTK